MRTVRNLSNDVSPELVRELGISDLAEVLFASPLQESDNPSPSRVRAAVEEALAECGGDCTPCAACVAQEAGDHPELYVRRMRLALSTVGSAYAPVSLAA